MAGQSAVFEEKLIVIYPGGACRTASVSASSSVEVGSLAYTSPFDARREGYAGSRDMRLSKSLKFYQYGLSI